MITLAIDCMGGDAGPAVTIPAVQRALSACPELRVVLFGQKAALESYVVHLDRQRARIVFTGEDVTMEDTPALMLRSRSQSALTQMLRAVANGSAEGCVSAGNTAALMVLGKHILKLFDELDRPAIVSGIPGAGHDTVMLDLGANLGCDSELLYQFGMLGSAMVRATRPDLQQEPRVALLNIGSEARKGHAEVRAAHELMSSDPHMNFVGFVEGNELFSDRADVIVCDGFVGNVALKTTEGLARYILSRFEPAALPHWWQRLLAGVMRPVLKQVHASFDPVNHSGAVLLGLRGLVVKSHGNSSVEDFTQAIVRAYRYANCNLVADVQRYTRLPLSEQDSD